MTTLALILALGAPAIAQETGAPSASGTPEAGAQFGTVDELMAATGLDGTVGTRGYAAAGDGAGMTYFVQPSNASGPLGDLAVPTADGVWAGRVIGGAGGAGGAGAGAGDGEPVAAGGAGADQDSADGALTLSPRAAARRSARMWEASW